MYSTKDRYSRNKTEEKQLARGMAALTMIALVISFFILGGYIR